MRFRSARYRPRTNVTATIDGQPRPARIVAVQTPTPDGYRYLVDVDGQQTIVAETALNPQ